jgi:branched-chain amino acid transport system ATP-binding protein
VSRPLVVGDLTVAFGGLRALDNVSLTVEEGRCVGLIGPNGAGKTTLFDAVTGIAFPESGRIELFGQRVDGWPLHRRARLGVGRTFQRLELFESLSVLDNVVVALESPSSSGGLAAEILGRPTSIGLRRRAEERACELLELTGLTELARARAGELPMGHARTLELARALATDPKLLLLDEPSSGLSEAEAASLAALFRRLQTDNELSLLVVEHDMGFVLPLSHEVYVLDFGKIIGHGSPDEIRRDPVVQAAYLGVEVT